MIRMYLQLQVTLGVSYLKMNGKPMGTARHFSCELVMNTFYETAMGDKNKKFNHVLSFSCSLTWQNN